MESAQYFRRGPRGRRRVRPVIVLLMGQATAQLTRGRRVRRRTRTARAPSGTANSSPGGDHRDDPHGVAGARRRPRRRQPPRGAQAVHKLYQQAARALGRLSPRARRSPSRASSTPRWSRWRVARVPVQGETQLRSTAEEPLPQYYLTKSYCKTASPMALSPIGRTALRPPLTRRRRRRREVRLPLRPRLPGGRLPPHPEPAPGAHAPHPSHLTPPRPSVPGDRRMLDYTQDAAGLGKPGPDLALGLSTAPVLTSEGPGTHRADRASLRIGDVARAVDLVSQSRGLQRTKELATSTRRRRSTPRPHSPEGEARDGLIALCHIVLSRSS